VKKKYMPKSSPSSKTQHLDVSQLRQTSDKDARKTQPRSVIRLEGAVKFFQAQRGFGYIAGKDGKDYFFHLSSVNCSPEEIADGQVATFEPGVTPKGYRAYKVELAPLEEMLYEVPQDVLISKTNEVKGWNILASLGKSISYECRNPDEGRESLKHLAKSMNANGIINFTVEKYTANGGFFNRNFYYTMHKFYGIPVQLGRRSINGTIQRGDLHAMRPLYRKWSDHDDKLNSLLTWGGIALAIIIVLIGMSTT
jgi:cold shock CspA family protein